MDARGQRWQYVMVNIGVFNTAARMARILGYLGANGYELAVTFDKSSNWLTGLEKGFMVFKRPVPAGAEPDGPWCEIIDRDDPKLSTDRGDPPYDPIDPPYL